MGTIVKRGEHQYRAQVRRKGQRSLSKTFEIKRDAEAWLQEVERKIRRGEIDDLDPTTQRKTVADALDDYEEHELPTLAREGASQRAPLRRIREFFGPTFVSAIRSTTVTKWVRELHKEKLSGQTIIHHMNALSKVIGHAQSALGVHLPAGNPVKTVKRPESGKARDRVLRDGEYDYLMRAARDAGDGPGQAPSPMLEHIIRLALETSMRQGELLALRWTWIDFKNETINLPADATKNGEARQVALSDQSIKILKELKGKPRHINGRVFGGWKDAQSLQKPWQRLLRRARRLYLEDCQASKAKPIAGFLEDLRFHDLRHHATTELFARGLNTFEVASMTGHKSMAMLKRYTHTDAVKLAKKLKSLPAVTY